VRGGPGVSARARARALGARRRTRRARCAAATLAAGVGLATGCTTLGLALASLRPLPRACPGPLVPVEALGPDFALQARYRVRSGGREEALLLAAEKRGARLVVVGFDPLGARVFAVVQEGVELRRERHVRALFPLPPENALRDLVEARVPDAAQTPAARGARVEREGTAVRIVRPGCDWEAALDLLAAAPSRERGAGPANGPTRP